MASPVDWDLARRVAEKVAGREPFADSYHVDSLLPDFEELTRDAEELVTAATGLVPATGPARVRVTDRPGWIAANVRSFQRLLAPLTDKLGDRIPGSGPVANVPPASWDRLSRSANVSRGADQWSRRLQLHANGLDEDVARLERDDAPANYL